MTNIISLKHITDVGESSGDGVDSTERIRKQYRRLGVEQPCVITAGHSPLHVAFAACTDVSLEARNRVAKVLDLLETESPDILPTALNSAPRNSNESRSNGQEDYIYRVESENKDDESLLIYGPEVLQWVLAFRGRIGVTVEKILAIPDVIKNTSNGSQFRSAEHLPIVHFIDATGKLDQHSERQNIELDKIPDISPENNGKTIVAPPDEYGNGRLIVGKKQLKEILAKEKIKIPGIINQATSVRKSLTEVTPDELSVWPSSNHFSSENLSVLNIGTRWKPGTTRTTNNQIIKLAKRLSHYVGTSHEVITEA